ncbi:hypothetical protein BTN50_2111 [Candidatus Enterovibrio altilux]|uniref:Mobile element protein n=1 Tax=Candidatus Enterovibrio altilux TaxID=1927128 RepID=A0A291BBW3_9GAMM|nr:hypothetical protein BTN50_2111 [Candidatus Enterovibrio luxaltus]
MLLLILLVCLRKLGSTLLSVTLDALNLAAMISCVLILTVKCNLRQTCRFPSVSCFVLAIRFDRRF